jgi:hypothetical protein
MEDCSSSFIFLYLLLLFLLFLVHPSQSSNIPAPQLNALKDLYYSTNGEDWTWAPMLPETAHWNFSVANPNPCVGWQGNHLQQCLRTEWQ